MYGKLCCLIIDHALQSTSIRVPTLVEKDKGTSRTDGSSRRDQTKQSIMEKQVSFLIPYESNEMNHRNVCVNT